MAGKLGVLVSKEVRELVRDPKILLVMILVPSLMFVIMGNVVGYAAEKTIEEVMKGVNVAFIDADGGWASRLLLSIVKSAPGASVSLIQPPSESTDLRSLALELAGTGNYDLVIVIPPGFTHNITQTRPAVVETYSVVKGLSLATGVKPELVMTLMDQYRERLIKNWLRQAFPDKDPDVMLRPFTIESEAVVMGKPMPAEAIAMLMSQSFILFLGPIILLSIATGIAAASVGVEKEEKTLETLLSLPVKRRDILFGKAIATLVVALLGTLSLSAGFLYYMHKITSFPAAFAGEASGGAGEVPEPILPSMGELIGLIGIGNLVVALLGVFVSIMLVLLLSIVISSLASNVREAQAMAGYIWLPLFVPMIVLMFVNITSFGTLGQVALALLPFATPLLALKAVFEGVGWVAYASLASNLVYNALVLYVGARWFEGERILTARFPRAPEGKRWPGSLRKILWRR